MQMLTFPKAHQCANLLVVLSGARKIFMALNEMIKVKSHGPRLNNFTTTDYDDAIVTMHSVATRADIGIVYRHGGAARVFVSPSSRPDKTVNVSSPARAPHSGHYEMVDEFEQRDLYTGDDEPHDFGSCPVNTRYSITQYVDSSFAVDPEMRSITGAVTLLCGGQRRRTTAWWRRR